MRISREKLIAEASATGFRPDVLEKVIQLLNLLEAFQSHPFLKGRIALKGGTALNIFLFKLPRMSVDVDLNYIGSGDRDVMLAERPKVEEAIGAVLNREGFAVRRMRRTIREREPVSPSTRLGALPEDERTTTAQRQQVEPARLVSQLRGDLDCIVLKALEKDRTRRYPTANDLALDIRRYLDNEPILARPTSTAYRFRKLVRRNKLLFAGTSAVAAALVIGLALSAWQYVEKSAAYRRVVDAEREQSRLRNEAEAAKRSAVHRDLVRESRVSGHFPSRSTSRCSCARCRVRLGKTLG